MAALTTALEIGTLFFIPTLYPTAHPSSRPAAGLPFTSKARHAAPVDVNASSYSGMARRDDSRGRRRDRRFRGDSQSSSMSTSANGDSGDSRTRGSATPLAYFSAGGGATQSSKVIGPGGRRGVGRRTGGAAIGGVKVETEHAWFAARPSGTEDVYKIYAESFRGPEHLAEVQAAAKDIVDTALGG